MSDLISRQEAIEAIKKSSGKPYIPTITSDTYCAVRAIESVPSAQPEREKGEWISHENYDECSKCHCFTSVGFSYCPYCGAEMRGVE